MAITILQAVLIFLGLNAFYWLIYKYLAWRKSFVQHVAARVRFWVYLLIPLSTINWVVAQIADARLAQFLTVPWISWLPRHGITIVLVVIVVETVLGLSFEYYAARRRIAVPQIIRSLVRGLIYLIVAISVMLYVFNIKVIAGILVGSAVILFGIGLLMQDALSNLFAGFSLEVTRLYRPGDWLTIGANCGQVEATDWRALTIRTADDDLITVPFSLLARIEVVNHTTAEAMHADDVQVVVDFSYPPERVERTLLAAVAGVAGVCPAPAPEVRLADFLDHGIRYSVRYWLAGFPQRDDVRSALRKAIWYHLNRADIRVAYPTAELNLHRPGPAPDAFGERAALLRQVAFLQALTPPQLEQLAARLRLHLFAHGEVICRQGEPGQTFYVISRGSIVVSACDDRGRQVFTQTLNVGDFFGEFSLMTGEPRSATVTTAEETELLVVDKEDIRQTLEESPSLAEHISAVLAHRRHELQASRDAHAAANGEDIADGRSEDSLRREILRMIGSFFGY